ncbi:MAG: hypothetical protein UV80_C0015G0008 [Candidatus Peregrinibacteria bacterium GW2011_GWF2_43_17]|nr:MAG: hypothetical protein UV80_C0015G0008 [Candidatus Peregrinibacteria bacterium GW2011_GWF2_43_17]
MEIFAWHRNGRFSRGTDSKSRNGKKNEDNNQIDNKIAPSHLVHLPLRCKSIEPLYAPENAPKEQKHTKVNKIEPPSSPQV